MRHLTFTLYSPILKLTMCWKYTRKTRMFVADFIFYFYRKPLRKYGFLRQPIKHYYLNQYPMVILQISLNYIKPDFFAAVLFQTAIFWVSLLRRRCLQYKRQIHRGLFIGIIIFNQPKRFKCTHLMMFQKIARQTSHYCIYMITI